MKILLTGDVHVGRSSSAVGVDGVAGDLLLASSAWGRIVDLAIEQGVKAVVVSGDLVEKANRYFEARGPIERGLTSLQAAGIRTIAVAGNHDADVLPQMADRFNGRGLSFELLGAGGCWRDVRLESGGESLHVLGWSFPQSEVRDDPLKTLAQVRTSDGPVLGVVHGELGSAVSRYAPLALERLRSAPVDGWLLGHIHVPDLARNEGGPWVLYPGSPQALDPGETGEHGAWIVQVASGMLGVPSFYPLSTVRYERHCVDVSACADASGLRRAIDDALASLAESSHAAGQPHLRDLVVDLEIVGQSPACTHAEEVIAELDQGMIEAVIDVHVRSTKNGVTPPLDLVELSRSHGLAGKLARAICQLESGHPEASEAASLLKSVNDVVAALRPQAKLQRGDDLVEVGFDRSAVAQEAILAARTLLGSVVGASRAVAGGGHE